MRRLTLPVRGVSRHAPTMLNRIIDRAGDLFLMLLGLGADSITVASAILAHRLLTPEQLAHLCQLEHRDGGGLVAGLIARRSVSILVGDSGLGKSPLAYQLGLCVAAGIPFLGMPTEQGAVVYADYENGMDESNLLIGRLSGFLGLPNPPANFCLWSPDHANGSFDLDAICSEVKPSLIILDSLRAHDPNFEKTDHAGEGMKRLRSAGAYKHSVAIIAIHHTKKPGPDGPPALDKDDTRLIDLTGLI